MATEFTDTNFEALVLQNEQPVLVDFWAPWCPPCRALGPVIDEVANEVRGIATVGKLNVDDYQAIAATYGVSTIPTVLVFRGGKVVETIVGLNDKKHYLEALTAVSA